jgi:CheY-like chemotaxis protein
VLVVEHGDALRTALTWILESGGHHVAQARNAGESLTLLRAVPGPLVVILDLRMPQMAGFALLKQIDADPQLARTHAFMVLTANGGPLFNPQRGLLTRLRVELISPPFTVRNILDTAEQLSKGLVHPPLDTDEASQQNLSS